MTTLNHPIVILFLMVCSLYAGTGLPQRIAIFREPRPHLVLAFSGEKRDLTVETADQEGKPLLLGPVPDYTLTLHVILGATTNTVLRYIGHGDRSHPGFDGACDLSTRKDHKEHPIETIEVDGQKAKLIETWRKLSEVDFRFRVEEKKEKFQNTGAKAP